MILKQGMKVLLKPKEWYDEKKADFLPILTNDMEQYFGKEHIIKSVKIGGSQLRGVELFNIESDSKGWYFSIDMVDKYYDMPITTNGYDRLVSMYNTIGSSLTSGTSSMSSALSMYEQLSLQELRGRMRGTTDFSGFLGFSNSLSIHVTAFIKYVEKFVPFAYDGVVTYTDNENNSFTLTQLYERFTTNS